MFYYQPVPIEEHSSLIGKDFSRRFANEMSEYYRPFLNKSRPIQLAKETWEYAVADSIDGSDWVGAGKNIIDVRAPSIEIDVKGLSCQHLQGTTTEASILQNNKLENDNFAKLFESKDFAGLKSMFVDPFFEKIKSTTNLHILCSIREKKVQNVHYCLLKVIEKPNDNFINEMYTDAKRSISVPMIDPMYGKVYLYIPKRRLEIRLKMNELSKFSVLSHSITNNLY
jgi:hypothetical protein